VLFSPRPAQPAPHQNLSLIKNMDLLLKKVKAKRILLNPEATSHCLRPLRPLLVLVNGLLRLEIKSNV
jgi:hypothetical protein